MVMEALSMEMGEMRMVPAPGHGRLFPRCGTKPAEKDSAGVVDFFGEIGFSKRPEGERKMAVAVLGARNKAVAGGIVKAASWSDFEICVTNQPEVALKAAAVGNKAAAVGAVAGDKAAAAEAEAETGNKTPAAEAETGNKAAGAVKKTKLVPVDVDCIKAIEARGPFASPEYPRGIRDHFLMCPAECQEQQDFRDAIAELAEEMQALSDKETAIIEQYRKYGYAYEEVEVEDNDHEEA